MKTNKNTSVKLAAVIIAVGLTTLTVPAATIDWGVGAQNITGDSDVSTAGTLVDAFGLSTADSAAAITVNGVTFAPYAFPALDYGTYSGQSSTSLGNYSFSENAGLLTAYDNLGYGSGAISGLSSAYGSLLSSGGSSTYFTTLSLTIGGLTVGQTYQFQWWDNNSSFISSPASGVPPGYTTATAGNSIGLNANDGSNPGSLGQFAIGTFTADAVTQEIDFDGNPGIDDTLSGATDPLINAFQLREITPAPEPSTLALSAMGGLGSLLLFRRRK
jgi:hypothetical protein